MHLPSELLEAAESVLVSNYCKCSSLLLAIVFCGRGWERRGRVVWEGAHSLAAAGGNRLLLVGFFFLFSKKSIRLRFCMKTLLRRSLFIFNC